MWKNNEQDIVGLCHYRRYFSEGFCGTGDYIDENKILKILDEYDLIAYKK
ncbi:MAG: DUF4422 domain-containing protein [Methanosphaera sp.]|nr:DUF4422 domain-containing protein [Methanosphaera sp.]